MKIVLCFFISFPLFASTNLDVLFESAKNNNPLYNASKNDLETAKLSYKAKRGKFLPKLGLKASKTRSENSDKLGKTSFDKTDVSLNASLNLFNGFSDFSNLKKEDYLVLKTEYNLELKELELYSNVFTSYVEYLFSKETISLLEKIVKRMKDQSDLLRLRFEGGREDKGSYLQTKAKYLDSVLSLDKAKRDLKLAEIKLVELTNNRAILSELKNEGLEDLKTQSISFDPSSIDSIIKKLKKYKLAKLDVEMSKKEVSIADSSHYPSIDLQASKGISGKDNNLNENTYGVGISLTLPLFEGGTSYYNSKISRTNKVSSEYKLRQNFNELREILLSSYNAFTDSKDNLELNKELLKALKVREKVATSQYQNGLMPYTNWDLVQSEYIKIERASLISLKEFLKAHNNLEKTLELGNSYEK